MTWVADTEPAFTVLAAEYEATRIFEEKPAKCRPHASKYVEGDWAGTQGFFFPTAMFLDHKAKALPKPSDYPELSTPTP